jgi:hypothetical protein
MVLSVGLFAEPGVDPLDGQSARLTVLRRAAWQDSEEKPLCRARAVRRQRAKVCIGAMAEVGNGTKQAGAFTLITGAVDLASD